MKRMIMAALRVNDAGLVSDASRECALSLLQRSVSFGHDRLAVLRLALAVRVGAHVPPEHWKYCEQVVEQSTDDALREIFSLTIAKSRDAESAQMSPGRKNKRRQSRLDC
jgi:hypothetical protein